MFYTPLLQLRRFGKRDWYDVLSQFPSSMLIPFETFQEIGF